MEIEYKGFSNGKWVYGTLETIIKYDIEYYYIVVDNIKHLIIKESLCRFTGYYDVNNTKLYTNDIYTTFDNQSWQIIEIGGNLFRTNTFGVYSDFDKYYNFTKSQWCKIDNFKWVEVITNIFYRDYKWQGYKKYTWLKTNENGN